MTDHNLPTTIIRDLNRVHDDLGDHAFTCRDTFVDAYASARNDGEAPKFALLTAVKKHDTSVEWTRANVGLD